MSDTSPHDVTGALSLPPDPEEPSGLPIGMTVNDDGTINVALAPIQPAPVVTTSPNVVAPNVTVDANNVPHVTIPMTKKTKGYVGTAVAVATTIGVLATQVFSQDPEVTGWIQVALGVIGAGATWLGIVLPTNLPIKIRHKV